MKNEALNTDTVMRWVKVEDRLPTEKGFYIAVNEYFGSGHTGIPHDRSDTYFDGKEFKKLKDWETLEWLEELPAPSQPISPAGYYSQSQLRAALNSFYEGGIFVDDKNKAIEEIISKIPISPMPTAEELWNKYSLRFIDAEENKVYWKYRSIIGESDFMHCLKAYASQQQPINPIQRSVDAVREQNNNPNWQPILQPISADIEAEAEREYEAIDKALAGVCTHCEKQMNGNVLQHQYIVNDGEGLCSNCWSDIHGM